MLGLSVLAMAMAPPAQAQGADRDACIARAVSPEDLDRPANVPGIPFAEVDISRALAACLPAAEAARAAPGDRVADRLLFSTTARALHGRSARDALPWYQEALDRGSALAAFNAGVIYRDGAPGIARRADLARQLFDYAWSQGLGVAGYELALAEAAAAPGAVPPLMRDLAERGEPRALRWMWGWHLGQGTRTDGARYLLALADQGDTDALIELAEAVGAGEVTVPDAEQQDILSRATAAGSALAPLFLARLIAADGAPENAAAMALTAWDRLLIAPAKTRAGNPLYLREAARFLGSGLIANR